MAGTPSRRSLDLDCQKDRFVNFWMWVFPILVKTPQDMGLMDPGQIVAICPRALLIFKESKGVCCRDRGWTPSRECHGEKFNGNSGDE